MLKIEINYNFELAWELIYEKYNNEDSIKL